VNLSPCDGLFYRLWPWCKMSIKKRKRSACEKNSGGSYLCDLHDEYVDKFLLSKSISDDAHIPHHFFQLHRQHHIIAH
jgi:hypothetical protein